MLLAGSGRRSGRHSLSLADHSARSAGFFFNSTPDDLLPARFVQVSEQFPSLGHLQKSP
jgi:hypothetical protein